MLKEGHGASHFINGDDSAANLKEDFTANRQKATRRSRKGHPEGTVSSPRLASEYSSHSDNVGREQVYLKTIKPKTPGQTKFLEAIDSKNLIMALGPAGTGKTYLAIAKAVEALEAGKVGRIVLSRPAIEAGESIGFLPGDMEDKLAPYLRPLYDALSDRLSMKRVRALMAEGAIEIAPIGYMRGRTLNNAFVVVDEAQNLTYVQLKMVLTRLGWNSKMVVTGDPQQSDLQSGFSGLADVADRFQLISNIAVIRLTNSDIVRHPLVGEMLEVLPPTHEGLIASLQKEAAARQTVMTSTNSPILLAASTSIDAASGFSNTSVETTGAKPKAKRSKLNGLHAKPNGKDHALGDAN